MTIDLHHGDCLEVMPTLADSSVDLILTDPPYFKVKGDAWDRQWDKPAGFLAWLDTVLVEYHRILKPNGSLYLFASPQMSARVECLIAERFEVFNSIRWVKEAGWHQKQKRDEMRKFSQPWESCLFAGHIGAESYAKGDAGYGAKCDELRGFVFEPLRLYLSQERDSAGYTTRMVAEHYQKKTGSRTVTGMAGHWFERVQWTLPTEENYSWLRSLFGDQYLRKEYEELRKEYEELRKEYEELRKEYEELRRPFNATPHKPYTDVWSYKTVQAYKGKHPCEKPLQMIEDMIEISTRPDAVVLDSFMGSGTTGVACQNLNRNFIGIEMDEGYFDIANQRINKAQLPLLETA